MQPAFEGIYTKEIPPAVKSTNLDEGGGCMMYITLDELLSYTLVLITLAALLKKSDR